MYVIGINDRHQDNMMLGSNGGLLHIDLEIVFGENVFFESSDFPIPFLYVHCLVYFNFCIFQYYFITFFFFVTINIVFP